MNTVKVGMNLKEKAQRLWRYGLMSLLCIAGSLSLCRDVSAAPEGEKKRIAVLELSNRTKKLISQEEINFLSNEMRRVAGYLPPERFLVMTKESMMVLIDPNTTLEDCVGTCEVETGRTLGADWILTGEVLRFGKSLRVSVKLHDTHSGQYLAGDSLKGRDVEELELSIKLSTLKLIYKISPAFEREIKARAGDTLKGQLACLGDASQCERPSASQRPITPNSTTRSSARSGGGSSSSSARASASSSRDGLSELSQRMNREVDELQGKRQAQPSVAQQSQPRSRSVITTSSPETRPQTDAVQANHHPIDLGSIGLPITALSTVMGAVELLRYRAPSGFQVNGFKSVFYTYEKNIDCDDFYDPYGFESTCFEGEEDIAMLFGVAGVGLFGRDSSGALEWSGLAYPFGVMIEGVDVYLLPVQLNLRYNFGALFAEASLYASVIGIDAVNPVSLMSTLSVGFAIDSPFNQD